MFLRRFFNSFNEQRSAEIWFDRDKLNFLQLNLIYLTTKLHSKSSLIDLFEIDEVIIGEFCIFFYVSQQSVTDIY